VLYFPSFDFLQSLFDLIVEPCVPEETEEVPTQGLPLSAEEPFTPEEAKKPRVRYYKDVSVIVVLVACEVFCIWAYYWWS